MGNVIENVLILDKTEDGERRIILAGSAELKDGGKDGISLDLEKAFIHSSKETERDDYDYARTSLLQYRVSNEDMIQTPVSVSPGEMSSRDVYAAVKVKRAELDIRINERKGRLVTQAHALENILRAGPDSDSWNSRSSGIMGFQREAQSLAAMQRDRSLFTYIIELYRKFSVPFGAFCFVFLAVSLGLMAKKSGQTVGFIFGIIIAVLYWSMLFIGQTMGLRLGTPPFWSMWYPNILSLTAGIILALVKVRR
jgi:lipopolysaccharide export system permease protein